MDQDRHAGHGEEVRGLRQLLAHVHVLFQGHVRGAAAHNIEARRAHYKAGVVRDEAHLAEELKSSSLELKDISCLSLYIEVYTMYTIHFHTT